MSSEGVTPELIPVPAGREYRGKQPPDYAALHACAEANIDPSLPEYEAQVAAASAVIREVENLNSADFGAAQRYAQGLMSCHLANELVQDGAQERLIEAGATLLASRHQGTCAAAHWEPDVGLYIGECVDVAPQEQGIEASAILTTMLGGSLSERHHNAPFAERLVADALSIVEMIHVYQTSNAVSGIMGQTIGHNEKVRMVLHDDRAVRRVVQESFSGAESLLGVALQKVAVSRGIQFAARNIYVLYDIPLAILKLGDDELRNLVPARTARQGALMRIDQIHGHELGQHARLTGNGTLSLAGVVRPTTLPPPQPGLVYLYRDTHCPAVEAQATRPDGTTTPLVPMVTPILVETIIRARNKLLSAQ